MLPSYVSLAPRPFPVRMWSAGRRKLHKLSAPQGLMLATGLSGLLWAGIYHIAAGAFA